MPDEGRDLIEKMVAANPANATAYLVRARFERGRKQIDDCLRDLDWLFELDPENADGLLLLAEIMQERGEIAEARAALSNGILLYQKDVRFYRALSWLERSSGNLPASVACLEQGIVQQPNAIELLAPLGDMLVQQGEIEPRAADRRQAGGQEWPGQPDQIPPRPHADRAGKMGGSRQIAG